MGMTWDEFWHCNTKVHKAVREAWEIKKQYQNWEMWMQGAYFYDALLRVAPVMRAAFGKGKVEPGEYPKEPYPLSLKEAEERKAAREKARFEKMLAVMNHEAAENAKKMQAKKEAVDDA